MNSAALLSLAACLAFPPLAIAADTQPATTRPATATRPTTATRPAPRKLPTPYTDAAAAPADFKLQGEYAAKEDGSGLGVQLISLRDRAGNTTFRAVVFQGGLPGAGWDGKSRQEFSGKLLDAKAAFEDPKGFTASADGVTLTGKLKEPAADFKLSKIDRQSPTSGAKPPENAVILFDGKDTSKLKNAKLTPGGLLAAGFTTAARYTDYSLHVEFMTPFTPSGAGQERGNSGIYHQNRYELQILDSFGLVSKDDDCAGVYKNAAPKINMCFPPLTWQTYDIDFTAAKWTDGRKTQNAKITVKHNGVLVHDNLDIKDTTAGGAKEEPTPGPLFFQLHNDPVVFRNLWLVEKK